MITVKDLSKKYANKVIFEKVNLVIPSNQITFIAGKNGSGKTTLLKCLLELEEYSGQIIFGDNPTKNNNDEIFVVYDNAPLYNNLTGYRNIELLLNRSISKEDINNMEMQILNPDILNSKVKTYSYGQRKKLSLVLALLNNPKYILLDEISNGLDYESLIELKYMLTRLKQSVTIVATGHHFEFYSDIIDRMIVINNHNVTEIDVTQNEEDLLEFYKLYVK